MNQIVTQLPHTPHNFGAPECSGLLGQMGNLQVRLARDIAEIFSAQRLRFDVFHNEFGAQLDADCMAEKRDHDEYDAYCDHLVVLDNSITGNECAKIVGTYRLMRKQHAALAGGYYSASEFAVAGLITRHKDRNFLELGRSCVYPAYRSKRTIELLWQGIWAYAQLHDIDVMMGCASFPGTIPAQHAEALTFLNAHARATGPWHVAPLPGRHVSMDLMPAEAVDMRSALSALPPLVKGYLRVGALFGDGAVIDPLFNTTDVMVVLPVERITSRYRAHYGDNAERYAA